MPYVELAPPIVFPDPFKITLPEFELLMTPSVSLLIPELDPVMRPWLLIPKPLVEFEIVPLL